MGPVVVDDTHHLPVRETVNDEESLFLEKRPSNAGSTSIPEERIKRSRTLLRLCMVASIIALLLLFLAYGLERSNRDSNWAGETLTYLSTKMVELTSYQLSDSHDENTSDLQLQRYSVIKIPVRSAFSKDEDEFIVSNNLGLIEPTLPVFPTNQIWHEEIDFGYYPWEEVTESPTPRPTRAPTMEKTHRPTRPEPLPKNKTKVVKTPPPEIFPENTYWREVTDLENATRACDERFMRHRKIPKSENYDLLKADCGLGYSLPSVSTAPPGNSSATEAKWRVFFVGSDWGDPKTRLYSGCPRKCPLSPNCVLLYDSEEITHTLEKADVIVAFSYSFLALRRPVRVPDHVKYRVVYWREASWSSPPLGFQKTEKFSFEMGVHLSAGIINPTFVVRPSELLRGAYMDEPKEYFAASVISDCGAQSRRDDYLKMVMESLSARGYRVHRYGKCGNRELPGTNLQQGMKYLAKYKFFFSFENTIQAGYATEKLFTALMLPLIPVFYGSPQVPNITRTPSFIRASDFPTPKHLAEYLIYLDTNPEQYARYGEWRRRDPAKAFTEEYLHTLQHRVAGPKEIQMNYNSERTAQCCRLCDPAYVKWVSERPKRESLVNMAMTVEDIDLKFFSGALGKS